MKCELSNNVGECANVNSIHYQDMCNYRKCNKLVPADVCYIPTETKEEKEALDKIENQRWM